jgi:hypothetical protein
MMQTPFVWLGSKRAKKRGVEPAGALIDLAARAGLPVPKGAVLLHEFYQLLLDEGLIHEQNGRINADDPQEIYEALYTAVRFPRLEKRVTLQPIFLLPALSMPGSIQHYAWHDAAQLTNSLCAAWSLAQNYDIRRDILVMELVAAEMRGTAVIKPSQPDDQIRYTQTDEVYVLTLPRLQRWKRPLTHQPPFAQRLQQLLRGIRRTINHNHLEIHWADDGTVCWLQQIIPLTKQHE